MPVVAVRGLVAFGARIGVAVQGRCAARGGAGAGGGGQLGARGGRGSARAAWWFGGLGCLGVCVCGFGGCWFSDQA